MKANTKLLIGAALFNLSGVTAISAQEVNDSSTEKNVENTAKKTKKNKNIEVIEVTGIRTALESGLNDKRHADQVVDVIVAEDIGNFSDSNIAETLQRLPGIQIGRSQTGEGSEISIRGLGKSITTMNGRTVFTGISRSINVKDIPSESLSGIKVYKSPQANQIEGGIAGTLDLQRAKTTNFKKFKGTVNVQAQYADLAKDWAPKFSSMIGNSFDTDHGKFGALIAVNHQTRNTRFDRQRTLSFTQELDGGKEDALASSGGGLVYGSEETTRNNIVGRVDWEVNDDTSYFFDFGYIDFEEDTRRDALNYRFGKKVTDANFDDPNLDVTKITYSNPAIQSLSQIEGRKTKTYDLVLGAEYFLGDAFLTLQASYVNSESNNTFTNMRLTDTSKNDTITVDYTGSDQSPPNVDTSLDTSDISNFAVDQFRDQITLTKSDEAAVRADLIYDLENEFFESVEVGLRYTQRDAERSGFDLLKRAKKGKVLGDASLMPELFTLSDTDFYNSDGGIPSGFVITNTDALLANDTQVRDTYDIGETNTAPADNIQFNITEKTAAAYVQANFSNEIGDIPFSGNIGLRAINTKRDGEGLVLNPDDEYISSISSNSETNFLPSLNVKFSVLDDVLVRVAASRVMSRPNFSDLAPGVRLNYGNDTARAGNPDLKAFTADQFDIGLEWYIDDSSAFTGVFFYKKVDGFLTRITETETFFGQEFETTRRANGDEGNLKGIALSYQQFFDFLPGIWQNFGFKMNATYIDSEAPIEDSDIELPLQDLSKTSYNLVGIYEDKKFSARITWNWRDKYFDFLSSGKPVYNNGGGVLDASFNYKISKKLKVKLSLKNINDKEVHTYYQNINRPRDFAINDRRAVLGLSYKF